jgi:8-oxo-dGTP pyrophosphatase MutT (NUDIX family)
MTTFDKIARNLACHKPTILPLPSYTRAAVALVLRDGTDGLEILFIERAPRADDPWSGDISFPGGKMEEGDCDSQRTAERETLEEIGFDLQEGRYLGRLSDIAGAHLPVLVSCHVYGVENLTSFVPNYEVRDLFWVSLADLNAPERHIIAPVQFDGEMLERPAIRLPQTGKPVLWGLTYRFIIEFQELIREGLCG